MFRAFSTRKSPYGYDRLGEECCSRDTLVEPQLIRARSVPARIFGFGKKLPQEVGFPQGNPTPKTTQNGGNKKKNKSHPLFSLFEGRWRKKKMTAKPEFARYMEYMKEGGRWNMDTDTPVIHYNK